MPRNHDFGDVDDLIEWGLTSDQVIALKSRNIFTMKEVCEAVCADRLKDIFPDPNEQVHVLCGIAEHMQDMLRRTQNGPSDT